MPDSKPHIHHAMSPPHTPPSVPLLLISAPLHSDSSNNSSIDSQPQEHQELVSVPNGGDHPVAAHASAGSDAGSDAGREVPNALLRPLLSFHSLEGTEEVNREGEGRGTEGNGRSKSSDSGDEAAGGSDGHACCLLRFVPRRGRTDGEGNTEEGEGVGGVKGNGGDKGAVERGPFLVSCSRSGVVCVRLLLGSNDVEGTATDSNERAEKDNGSKSDLARQSGTVVASGEGEEGREYGEVEEEEEEEEEEDGNMKEGGKVEAATGVAASMDDVEAQRLVLSFSVLKGATSAGRPRRMIGQPVQVLCADVSHDGRNIAVAG